MVTIRMIAQQCGVSTATVSKAINHESDISEETGRRVRQVAKEMGYFPNAAARALKTRHSHNLGVLSGLRNINGLQHEYVSKIIGGIQDCADESGYDITLLSSRVTGTEGSYADHCRYRNLDGVIVVCQDFRSAQIADLMSSEIPCVSIDCQFADNSAIMTDNEKAMKELVQYVYELGHRKLALISGDKNTLVSRIRQAAFLRTCDQLGVRVPDVYMRDGLYHDLEKTGAETNALLNLPDPPTCIFFPDDFSYLGGLKVINEHGLRVPEDISAVGFDGIYLSQIVSPALTTYTQDALTIGSESVKILREAIEQARTYIPRLKIVPGKICPGGSVRRLE